MKESDRIRELAGIQPLNEGAATVALRFLASVVNLFLKKHGAKLEPDFGNFVDIKTGETIMSAKEAEGKSLEDIVKLISKNRK